MKIQWHNEKRTISELNPAKYNPRRLTDKQVKDLDTSLQRFNLADPIVINKNNTIIGGHQRINILKTKGINEVDVRVPDKELTEEQEKELNLRLNKNLGEWDYDLLADFDEDLLKDVGFESEELDKIFQLDTEPEADEVPEVRETDIKLGDMFQLGEHRLLCGDSTKREDVEMLMAGAKADMVFTDPPYNVDYSGRGKTTSNKIQNDNQTEDAFREFLNKAFKNLQDFTNIDAPVYVCYASRTHREFEDALNLNNYEVKNQIIWVKNIASMGWGDYRWKHEPIFYVHQKGIVTPFFGDRKEYTEWTEQLTDEQLLKRIKRMIEKEEKGDSTVWRLKREWKYDHPTQKPIQLLEIALYNSSQRNDIILDLFLGSGSTLIACERLNRKCYGMEIDPVYCQVIVDRYIKYTNKEVKKINV